MLYSTDGRLSRVPGLLHGFGRKGLTEPKLEAFARQSGMRPVLLDQVHSDHIHFIEDAPTDRPRGDAVVTNVPGLLLVIKTADCLPLLLLDGRLRVVAAVHAGWRGTLSRLAGKTVRTMADRFGTDPADVIAAAGPCIEASCYEVGEEVRREFLSAGFPAGLFVPAGRPGKSFFDLRAANDLQLRSSGVGPSVPAGSKPACTRCDPGLHSFRRDRDASRRMFSFIGLRLP